MMLPSNRRERNTLSPVMPRRRSGDGASMRLQGLKRELIHGYVEGRSAPADTLTRRFALTGFIFAGARNDMRTAS